MPRWFRLGSSRSRRRRRNRSGRTSVSTADVVLSLLVPSYRPSGLEALRESLAVHGVWPDTWEVVALVDDERAYVEFQHRYTDIHHPPQRPVSVAHLLHECYTHSRGEWIMFGNDDIVCETPEWDRLIFDAITQHDEDGLSLFWPEDQMFG